MAKAIGQAVLGLFAVAIITQFSTKTGITIGEIVQGLWNIALTVGRAAPVPGNGSSSASAAAVLPSVGLVFGAGSWSSRRSNHHLKGNIMTSLRTLALRLFVKAQVAASDAARGGSEALVPADRTSRLQIGSGVAAGAFGLSTAAAMAAKPGKSLDNITNIISTVSLGLVWLTAAGAILMLVWCAFLYTTAGGSSARVGQAKAAGKNVIIGLCIAAGVFIIRSVVLDLIASVGGDGTKVKNDLSRGKLG